MDFQLNIRIPQSSVQLKHGAPVVLLGSCFSDNLLGHFKQSGFQVSGNPFGTLFHPLAIATIIKDVLSEAPTVPVIQRDELFFSWKAASTVVGESEEELHAIYLEKLSVLRNQLSKAQCLVLSFGTAHGYRLLETNELVANCHKMPQGIFKKELSSIAEMHTEWRDLLTALKEKFPQLNIVFTVSPVRHKKDGLIDNNRSKARLIELVHALCQNEAASYFPSYELVMDVLRDYRFFTTDMVHPTSQAVEYVWEHFQDVHMSEETRDLNKRVNRVYAMINHRSLFPESNAAQQHRESAIKQKEILSTQFPEVFWGE